jgi:hypothetical protein
MNLSTILKTEKHHALDLEGRRRSQTVASLQ